LLKFIATLPCHNDESFLKEAVIALKEGLSEFEGKKLIIIAEDGSSDGSTELADKLATNDDCVVHIHSDKKLGRGRALMNAWNQYEGDIYSYIDCDLATDMTFFPQLIQYIIDGYDLATGSRYIEGAVCRRPLLRGFISKAYNAIISFVFHDGVLDHQCGFKSFSKGMVQHMLREYQHDDWFWDTEVIVLARKGGFKLVEFPVVWEEKKGNRTPIMRLLKDIWIHGVGTIKLILR
jgi:glycosyltransferase involved in cell wall biosynthesis